MTATPPDLARPDVAPPGRATVALDGIAELDRLIFEDDEWWSASSADQAARRARLVSAAVAHHVEHCPGYGRFAERAGVGGLDLTDPRELARVPQLPTQAFKRTQVRSVPARDCDVFLSSGTTTGLRGQVWRDETTLQRLAGSLRPDGSIWHDLYADVDLDEDGDMIHLGPPRREAAGVWISYVMTLVEMFTATRSYVRDGVLRLGDAVAGLRTALAAGRFVCVTGPPVFVMALLDYLDDNDIRLAAGDRLAVMTAGGWKRDQRSRVAPAELRDRAVRTLGLAAGGQVRDVFNQVELNTAFAECESHSKHVPPWVEVVVRDPRDLSVLPAGEVGLLSYLDPSAASYPCFILCEDFGRIEVDRCACGRRGTTIEVHRRIETAANQGCALRLAGSTRLGAATA